VSVHARLGIAVIAVAVVGALLTLLTRSRPGAIPTVRVFVRLCAGAAAVEALVGLAMVVAGQRPADAIHFFYGAATVIPIPAAEALARRVHPQSEMRYLLVGAISTALFGLRAVTTGNS
jgi:cytochrome b561